MVKGLNKAGRVRRAKKVLTIILRWSALTNSNFGMNQPPQLRKQITIKCHGLRPFVWYDSVLFFVRFLDPSSKAGTQSFCDFPATWPCSQVLPHL